MTGIKTFRNKYSLTQEQLAFYLSVSPSMIKMAETGKRILSAAALIKLNQLMQTAESQVAAKSYKDDEAATVKDKQGITMIKKRIQEINMQVAKLEKSNAVNRLKQQQGLQKKELVQQLSASGRAKKEESSWMRLIELEANAQYSSYNSAKQQADQARIDGLCHEKIRLMALLGDDVL